MENYLDLRNSVNYKELEKTAKIIKDGGIVVFPTETVYGIGTNGLEVEAIKKLYEVKNRPFNNPISLLVSDVKMIESVVQNITKEEYKLINAFMPGPLTLILNKKDIVPNILTANFATVGIRMPENEIALELIKCVGSPIATTSANIAGEQSGTEIKEIMKEFKDNVDYYIDGGKSELSVPSTIVQVIEGKPHILRKGSITEEQVKEVLN